MIDASDVVKRYYPTRIHPDDSGSRETALPLHALEFTPSGKARTMALQVVKTFTIDVTRPKLPLRTLPQRVHPQPVAEAWVSIPASAVPADAMAQIQTEPGFIWNRGPSLPEGARLGTAMGPNGAFRGYYAGRIDTGNWWALQATHSPSGPTTMVGAGPFQRLLQGVFGQPKPAPAPVNWYRVNQSVVPATAKTEILATLQAGAPPRMLPRGTPPPPVGAGVGVGFYQGRMQLFAGMPTPGAISGVGMYTWWILAQEPSFNPSVLSHVGAGEADTSNVDNTSNAPPPPGSDINVQSTDPALTQYTNVHSTPTGGGEPPPGGYGTPSSQPAVFVTPQAGPNQPTPQYGGAPAPLAVVVPPTGPKAALANMFSGKSLWVTLGLTALGIVAFLVWKAHGGQMYSPHAGHPHQAHK